jgi:hypothetical protein
MEQNIISEEYLRIIREEISSWPDWKKGVSTAPSPVPVRVSVNEENAKGPVTKLKKELSPSN